MTTLADAWFQSTNYELFMRTYEYNRCIPLPYNSYIPQEDVKRVFAIGDFHGDFEAAIVCLRDLCKVMTMTFDAESIEPKYDWIAPEGTFVVVLGDVVDRARRKYLLQSPGEIAFEEIRILHMLNQLAERASQNGGGLIRLIGNHEIGNIGYSDRDVYKGIDWAMNYVTVKSIQHEFPKKNFGTKPESEQGSPFVEMEPLQKAPRPPPIMIQPESIYPTILQYQDRVDSFQGMDALRTYNSLLIGCNPRVMIQIGPYLFMHGGLRKEALAAYVNTYNANATTMQKTSFADFVNDTYMHILHGEELPFPELAAMCFDNPTYSVLWDRQYAQHNVPYNEKNTVETLKYYNSINAALSIEKPCNVEHLVLAHCFQTDRKATEDNNVLVHGNVFPEYTDEVRITKGPNVVLSTTTPSHMHAHGINCSPDGRVWRVDIAMSRAFDCAYTGSHMKNHYECVARQPSVLFIENDKTYTILARKALTRRDRDRYSYFLNNSSPL